MGAVGPAWGQGAGRGDRQAVGAALEPASAPPRAAARPAVVDLRDRLPAVGEQTMNDCVGWAYGYAARTYLEAVDQDWRPDDPSRIFSPTFIYNQINGGQDKGSSPIQAVELLRDRGAATLRAQPYLAGDYRGAVSEPAVDEATAFRIEGFGILESGEQVREALAAGYVVCIGVRTNPMFSSGRYDVYTQALHEEGIKQRRPDQPHGYHAMVIAGYDDVRGAFLFMNSWGQGWGDGGYVWVGYDAADTFNLNRETEFLVDYAIVMIDRREPVVQTEAGYRAVTPESLQLAHRFRVTGVGEDGGLRYDVDVEVSGPDAMLGVIASVRWTYPGQGGAGDDATFDTAGPRAILSVSERDFAVEAEVRFEDGRSVRLEKRIVLPESVRREVAVRRIDAYSHAELDVAQFRWTLVPEMGAQDWAALLSIEWHVERGPSRLDAMLRPNLLSIGSLEGDAPAVYRHEVRSQPATRVKSLAYPSGINGEAPRGFARFAFADGSSVDVALPAEAMPAGPREANGIEVSHVSRSVGEFGGKTWWYVEAKATIPERWHPFIVGAKFVNEGRNHDFTKLSAVVTDGLEPLGYVAQDYAWFPYNVSVEVLMRRGDRPRMFDRPPARLSAEQLLAGAVGVVRTINVPDRPIVTEVPGALAGLRYSDVYLGLDGEGRPRWRYFPFFADTQWARNFHGAGDWNAWRFSDPQIGLTEMYDEPIGGMPNFVVEAGRGVTMSAPCVLWNNVNGVSIEAGPQTFEVALEPTTPASTGLTLRAIEQTAPALLGLDSPPTEPMIEVDLLGGLWEQQAVRRVEYLVERPGGWAQAVVSDVADLTRPDLELHPARLPLPPDGRQRAVVHRTDGGVMALETEVRGPTPFTVPPAVSLTAISQYWGTENGRPHWRATLGLDGLLEVKPTIAGVTYEAEDELGSPVGLTVDGLTATTLTATPLRVRAEVTFNDGSEPLTLRGTILTPAETVLPDGVFELTHALVKVEQEPYNPNTVDSFAVPMPVDHVAVHLRAPLRDLQGLREVTYTVDRGWGEKDVVTADAEGKTSDALPIPSGRFAAIIALYTDTETTITAELLLEDGNTQTLTRSAEAGFEFFAEPAITSQPYASDPPRWLASITLPKKPQQQRNDLVTAYEVDGTMREATFHRPSAVDVFVVDRPVSVTRYHQLRVNPWGEPTSEVRAASVTLDPAVLRPDVLRVETQGDMVHITPDFNGVAFEGAEAVWYEVERDGEVAAVHPVAWAGPAHERFGVAVRGTLPDAVSLHATFQGEDIELATWRRP